MTNTLFYGDNLDILTNPDHIAPESVDLIYLDPPFNSNRSYNVLFREASGAAADAQITAFDDTWHWGPSSEETLAQLNADAPSDVVNMINAIVGFVGRNDVTAYLVMMTIRLVALHRVLKPTGSIYLHCDPTASHYLKVVMDTVFGKECYRNEIVWRRYSRPKGSQHQSRTYGASTDSILFYSKTDTYEFHLDRIAVPLDDTQIDKRMTHSDDKGPYYSGPLLRSPSMGPRPNLVYTYAGFTPGPEGWRMTREKLSALDAQGDLFWTKNGIPRRKVRPKDSPGQQVDNLWIDIEAIGSQAKERLGYPTQKPLALLERIIEASSNPGDVVLDPFCGCGTAVVAAQKLGRQWLGIDITHLAVGLMRSRLHDMFGPDLDYRVVGVPVDVGGARALAEQDRYEFQHWALGLVPARAAHGGKKGADGGIDGELTFQDTARGKYKRVVIQVKSGHVQRHIIGDLAHAMAREKAELAFLITLDPPTKPMLTEALAVGYYDSPGWGKHYQRVQIRTIDELLAGQGFDYPPANMTFARAERVDDTPDAHQPSLL